MTNRWHLAVALLAIALMAPACKKKESGDAPAAAQATNTETPATDTPATDEKPPAAKDDDAAEQKARLGAMAQFSVEDFDAWKKVFEGAKPARVAAGIRGHHIHQDPEDKNLVTLYLGFSDPAKFKAWLTGDELKATMKEAGVKGPPKVTVANLVADDTVDKAAAEIFVTHEVEDFDKWLEGYKAADDVRKKAGITGHAVARTVDNPNIVLVYHQADSVAALKAFVESPELEDAMTKAGVKGKPEIVFTTSTEPFILY